MASRLRSVWKQIQQHRLLTLVIIVVLIAWIAFAMAVWWFGWDWTGFTAGAGKVTITRTPNGTNTATELQPARTLWDWLGLLAALAIPVVVGFGAAWFTSQQGKVSDAENTDNQREAALQAYIDKISELLLEKNLRGSEPEKEVRKIARVRTLTVLPRLDSKRKRSVLQFLYESGLIDRDKSIVDMHEADLSKADLSNANLYRADLRSAHLFEANLIGANLREAYLQGAKLIKADLEIAYLREANLGGANLGGANLYLANLTGADLSEANLTGANLLAADLTGADLSGADLTLAIPVGADLSGANLTGAKVTQQQLKTAHTLQGATMPDGSIHP